MLRGTSPMLRFSTRAVLGSTASATPAAACSKLSPSAGTLRQLRPALSQNRPVVWRTQYSTKPSVPPTTKIDREHEKKVAQQKLEARPDEVSSESSVRHFLEFGQDTSKTKVTNEDAEEVFGDLRQDINNVVETVALDTVPRNAYRLGLAGTVPYLFTSLSTVYLSWNLNTPWPTDNQLLNSFMVSNATASEWLAKLEPIQLGYGAVIISFLGAVHWGLELAEKKPSYPRTNFRYAMGVIAPAVAWPTLLLPIEWALTGQFAAFVGLYFADARATARGWTPQWYATYRFVLTAIVGGAIFASLLGRFKVGEEGKALSSEGLRDTLNKSTVGAEPYAKWEKKEIQEKERIHEEKEKEQEAKKRKEAEKKADEKNKKGSEEKKTKDDGDEKKKKDGGEEKKQDKKDGGDEKKQDKKEKHE